MSNLGIAGSCQKTDWEDNKCFAFSNENLGGGNRSWWSITGWSDLGYEVVKYGTKLTFAGPWSAWCEDAGKTRCVSSTPGVYANAAASGSPILSATIKGNTTVYVDWPWSGYDGVMSARS